MTLNPVAYKPYADPDDFIREVTDLIWVQRVVASSSTTTSRTRSCMGPSARRRPATRSSTAAWCASRRPHTGRTGRGHHLGGPRRRRVPQLAPGPLRTDRVTTFRFPSRTIANCLYRRGRMVEEWVVRDSLAGALQAAIDPEEAGSRLGFAATRARGATRRRPTFSREGDSGPRPDDYRPECEMVLEFIDEVWNHRDLNRSTDFMVRDLVLQTVGDTT